MALVTGGSGGLGAAVCRALDAEGFSVGVHANRRLDVGEKLAAELTNPSFAASADLTAWSQARDLVEQVEHELGPLAVLVNCAGVRRDGLMAGQSPTDWVECVSVNLIGTFHACRAAVPQMLRRRHGRIVNVVSPAGLAGSAGQTAYSASKAGVIGLTRSLARECGRRDVTVNALSPGYMETAMTATLPAEAKARLRDVAALGRAVEPEEVAKAVPFIVACDAMTGQVVAVDGGIVV